MRRIVLAALISLLAWPVLAQVPGPSSVIRSATWATMPLASPANQLVVCTNCGAGGMLLRSTGTRWKPANGCAILASRDTASSALTNSPAYTIVLQTQIPAGFLKTGDRLLVRYSQTRSGSTDVANSSLLLGSLGTTSDAALGSSGAIAGSNLSAAAFVGFRIDSASTVQQITISNGNIASGGGYSSASSNAGTTAAVSLSGGDTTASALWLSLAAGSAGATNTTIVRDAVMEYCATAN